MTEADAKAIFRKEGYHNVYTWFDSPEEEYPTHAHPTQRSHFVIQGQMTVTMNNETRTYHPGERLDIDANVEHLSVVGPEGCTYVVGERSA